MLRALVGQSGRERSLSEGRLPSAPDGRLVTDRPAIVQKGTRAGTRLLQDPPQARLRFTTLSRLGPICAICSRIRDERGTWRELTADLAAHSETRFTQGLCPTCQRQFSLDFDEAGVPSREIAVDVQLSLPFERRALNRASLIGDRRRAGDIRWPVRLLALAEQGQAGREISAGFVRNLSRHGARLHLNRAALFDAPVQATVRLRHQIRLRLLGRVVWVRSTVVTFGWEVGVQFGEDLSLDLVADIAATFGQEVGDSSPEHAARGQRCRLASAPRPPPA